MERKIIVNATQTKKDSMFIVQPVIAHCTTLHESKTFRLDIIIPQLWIIVRQKQLTFLKENPNGVST